jgi:hypothetical protein
LSPPEYRLLFEAMAQEITENNLSGAQTILNIIQRARERGLELRRDDVRFVLEVVSETDPWFEQGASANLFAGRFRNFVVARCRSQGLNLSADELDLIDAWFAGNAPLPTASAPLQRGGGQHAAAQPQALTGHATASAMPQDARSGDRFFLGEGHQRAPAREAALPTGQPTRDASAQLSAQPEFATDEFPRIVRTRLRG